MLAVSRLSVASAAGVDIERVQRFANPVLLERVRAAELATAAHPVLADGPSVLTLLETVTTALVARGLDPDVSSWDAWRRVFDRLTPEVRELYAAVGRGAGKSRVIAALACHYATKEYRRALTENAAAARKAVA